MRSQILGIEYHLPEEVFTNEDIQRENPDWNMDELGANIGITQRHKAAEDEFASDMACEAATKLLDRQLVPPEKIDYILYCTQSPDYYMPATACQIQTRLGLSRNLGAFDYNLGCSGYVYGLGLAKGLIATGQAGYVLLITTESCSKTVNHHDRACYPLFGDAAAATLIGPGGDGPGDIGELVLRSNGKGHDKLIVPAGGLRIPRTAETAIEKTDKDGNVRSLNNTYMDGTAVFAFAITCVPKLIKDMLEKADLTSGQIDWYVYHQANKFMLEQLYVRSKIPNEKAVMSFDKCGNTSSSTMPIAMKDYLDAGRIKAGHKLMLVGFGVGWSWGACTITWGSQS